MHRIRTLCAGVLASTLPVTLITSGVIPNAAVAQSIQVVKVKALETAGGGYKFDGLPSTLKGGNIRFELTNAGKEPHDLQIVRLDGLHSVTEVVKIVGSEDTPIPLWMHGDGGIGVVAPGQIGSATMNLGPGKYILLCTESNDATHKSHAAGGMTGSFTVTGPKAASVVGGATATVTAKEYGFEFQGLKAGKNVVLFVNAGKELHHFQMFPILAGKTLDDVKKALAVQGPPTGPPPIDFTKGAGSAVIEKSEGSSVTEINLVPGRYAVMCFLNDRIGGPPHFMKGMLTELTIK